MRTDVMPLAGYRHPDLEHFHVRVLQQREQQPEGEGPLLSATVQQSGCLRLWRRFAFVTYYLAF